MRDDDLLTIWVVYHNPRDHPGKWVLRGQDIGSGTVTPRPACYIADSYEKLLTSLPPGVLRMPRYDDDDPVIYESWM
jgi:hypothetical protein